MDQNLCPKLILILARDHRPIRGKEALLSGGIPDRREERKIPCSCTITLVMGTRIRGAALRANLNHGGAQEHGARDTASRRQKCKGMPLCQGLKHEDGCVYLVGDYAT